MIERKGPKHRGNRANPLASLARIWDRSPEPGARLRRAMARRATLSGFEALESRQLMTAKAFLSQGGELQITGTPRNDSVYIDTIQPSPGVSQIRAISGTEGEQTLFQYFNVADVRSIRFEGLGGNDSFNAFWLGQDLPIHADGGEGNDVMRGGPGDDTMIGGLGNDWLDGGPDGLNLMEGGLGDDTYAFDLWQRGRSYVIEAEGEGADTLDFSAYHAPIIIDLSFAAYTLDPSLFVDLTPGTIDRAVATRFDDVIFGDDAASILEGGPGNDLLFGNGGDDTLFGGDGNDTLFGGAGSDTLHAMTGTEVLNGGEGSDRYLFLPAAAGHKEINEAADEGFDTLDFSGRTENLRVDLTVAVTQRVASNLTFKLQTPDVQQIDHAYLVENVVGGSGNDLLIGNSAANRLEGGRGHDTLMGGTGDDTYVIILDGSRQDDTIVEPNNDSGADTIDLSSSQANASATIDLNRVGFQSVGWNHRISLNLPVIENAIGTSGNDVLIGNGMNNRLEGGPGDDRIEGRAGDDVIDGGAGNDFIIGHEGNDWLIGGGGDDHFIFNAGLKLGVDTVEEHEEGGADTLDFSAWPASEAVVLDLTLATAQVLNPRLTLNLPGHSVENARGGAGNDRLKGGPGANRLVGNAGHDLLEGGEGDDTLDGGAGNDTLIGGLDDDVYRFDADLVDIGIDQLTELADGGQDTLDFSETSRPISIDLGRRSWTNGPHALSSTIGGQIENLTGGAGDDYLVGTNGPNRILGGPGVDKILGKDGDDFLDGGDGNDNLRGENGNDTVRGGNGNDVIYAGNGDDLVEGDAGDDSLYGEDGHDTLIGGAGNDLLSGDSGDDTYRYLVRPGDQLGSDTISDSAGVDTLDFSESEIPNASINLGRTTTQTYGISSALSYRLASPTIENVRGGRGDETILGNTLNNRLSGGEGDDYLWGGPGNDYLEGGPGRDTLSDHEGSNQVFSDSEDIVDTGSGTRQFRTGARRFSAPELSFVDPRQQRGEYSGLYVELVGDVLSLMGPSGYGFKLAGDWSRGGNSVVGETFTSSGTIRLTSDYHGLEIPLHLPGGLTIRTLPDLISNGGDVAVDGLSLGNVSMNFDSTDSASPFALFGDLLGLDFDLPSLGGTGVTMGLALGQELLDDDQGRFDDVPINPAVPYLYFQASVGLTASIGGLPDASVSELTNASVLVVIDPADPMVYLHAGLPIPTLTELAFAGSNNGYIPFTPAAMPTAPTDPILGNFYALATIDLSPKYPVSITGEVVVDLDANDDGTLANITGDNIARFFKGEMSSEEVARNNPLNDIRFGLNGSAELNFSKAGFDLALPVGSATLMYQPGMISFRGEMEDPFEGTVVRDVLGATTTYDIDGHIDWRSGDVDSWHVTLGASNLPLAAGLRASRVELDLSNQGLEAYARIDSVGGIGTAELRGAIYYNGDFSLRAYANLDLDAKIARVYFNTTFVFESFDGNFKFYADMNAGLRLGTDSFNISLDVSASLSFQVVRGQVWFSGKGEARGSVQLGLIRASVTLGGIAIDNDGFTLILPVVPDISISW